MLIVAAPIILYGAIITGMHVFENGWVAILGYHLSICIVLTAGGGWSKAREIFRGWNARIGTAVAVVCSICGVLIVVLWPLARLDNVDMTSQLGRLGLGDWSFALYAAYYCLFNPWLEEVFWRGYYASHLARPVISDVLFAGYHVFVLVLFVEWMWLVLAFVILLFSGWMWRYLARKYGGLLIPASSHLTANVSIIVAASILMFS